MWATVECICSLTDQGRQNQAAGSSSGTSGPACFNQGDRCLRHLKWRVIEKTHDVSFRPPHIHACNLYEHVHATYIISKSKNILMPQVGSSAETSTCHSPCHLSALCFSDMKARRHRVWDSVGGGVGMV